MQVGIQVLRAGKALDQGDRASLGLLALKAGLLAQVCGDAAVDDAGHPAEDASDLILFPNSLTQPPKSQKTTTNWSW